MLEIRNLDILVGTRYLIKDLSFNLNSNDKLAIIGEEGDGKSTLLKTLLDICDYVNVSGTINFKNNRVGYLPQTLSINDSNKTIYKFLFKDDFDYYCNVGKLYKYLESLNINENILDGNMNCLSGGEKIKVQILKLLLEDNEILLLDEPTNDIDLDTLKWLEKFIIKINKPVIFVSHDEMFLERTANMILHLEQIKRKNECKHTISRISYKDYVNNRISAIEKQTKISYSEKRKQKTQEEKLNQIMNKVEHQQNIISRSNPHGAKMLKKKMHSLKSQEKRMNEKELTEVPDVEESIYFKFDSSNIHSSKEILKLNIDELTINDKILSKNIFLNINGPEHIVIIGNNGIGKTTLIKRIYNILASRENIKVGYMPQNYDEELLNYETPIDFLCPDGDKENITKARMYLGNMKFTGDEMVNGIKYLSGGSKSKLFLIKLVLEKNDVLILDEPTRNLSPLSNPIVRKCISDFDGTVISISHDRKYIEEVSHKIYKLTEDGLKELNKEELM